MHKEKTLDRRGKETIFPCPIGPNNPGPTPLHLSVRRASRPAHSQPIRPKETD